MALVQLRRNWTRTVLTSLGISVGVGALVAIVGIGQGAARSIDADLASMGDNLVILEAGTGGGPQAHVSAPPFRDADVDALRRQVSHLAGVAPVAQASVTAAAGGASWQTTVTGSSPDWVAVGGWSVSEGRGFDEGEARSGSAVCVLGRTVQTALFGEADAVGARVRLGRADCTVIGVLEAKGDNTMGMDQDDLVLVPLAFVQRRLSGTTGVDRVLLSVDDPQATDRVLLELDQVVRDLRHVRGDATVDFEIRDTREMAERIGGVTTMLTALLGAVAAVSLLVGGVGIMNVMLVSVGERTHEIGIRMAVGALQGDVMAQFLVESATLSALGGLAGVVLGVAMTAVGAVALGVPFVVVPWAVLAAVGCSAGLGVLFGWFPARRASRLEPIDALRAP